MHLGSALVAPREYGTARAEVTFADSIFIVTFRVPRARATLLYSHGNAVDCGDIFPLLAEFALRLRVNVVAYDYPGYGASAGTPVDRRVYAAAEAAYSHAHAAGLCSDPGRELIVFGQSIGSGPSCYIAQRNRVAGLILHSPFTSGLRVLTESRLLCCFDIFPNIDRVPSIPCPVFILHGREDDVVPFAHGQQLQRAVAPGSRFDPWWVDHAGHNDIIDRVGDEYFSRLAAFIDHAAPG